MLRWWVGRIVWPGRGIRRTSCRTAPRYPSGHSRQRELLLIVFDEDGELDDYEEMLENDKDNSREQDASVLPVCAETAQAHEPPVPGGCRGEPAEGGCLIAFAGTLALCPASTATLPTNTQPGTTQHRPQPSGLRSQ